MERLLGVNEIQPLCVCWGLCGGLEDKAGVRQEGRKQDQVGRRGSTVKQIGRVLFPIVAANQNSNTCSEKFLYLFLVYIELPSQSVGL